MTTPSPLKMRNRVPGRGGRGADERTRRVAAAALEATLRQNVSGEVRFDAGSRGVYAHDASNYRRVPIGVVVPRTVDDVVAAVAAAREHDAPVVSRGGGTGLSGATVNTALVIDHSKYLRRIHEIDPDRRTARVDAGVIRDELADRAEEDYGLTFAPDTSTHRYATFGGMIAANSCGVHTVMGGRTSDNVESLDVLLYDGTRLEVGATSDDELEAIVAAGGRRGELYGALRSLRDRHAAAIRERYPPIPRRVSGYNLDELLPEKGFHVARALAGSDGTLATLLGATVRLLPSPPVRSLLVLGYPSVFEAADHVPEVLEHGPIGLEGIDDMLVENMAKRRMHPDTIPNLPDGRGWLLVEFGGEDADESHGKAQAVMEALKRSDGAPTMRLFHDAREAERMWLLREDALGATAFVPAHRDSYEGWEDAAVPPERLGGYLRDFRGLLRRHGYRTSLYGHFGDGCVHCRIDFALRSAGGVERWRAFVEQAAELVVSYGGSLSGEHGDGQSRGELLPKMFGEQLTDAFREFKAIWDPDWRMNPGKVVEPRRFDEDLKLGSDYTHPPVKTHFSYPEDGGSFDHAVGLRCVGVGKCRDVDAGTMCPSYMVTREEEHTTRGRARILFEMLEGETITDGFRSEEVNDALDLCLACKGCKGDCPVNVDMATYKAEFLAGYHKRRLRPRAAYAMGLIMLHARLAARVPRLANAVARAPGLGGMVKRAGGIAPERELPPFAPVTFRAWWRQRPVVNPGGPAVVLFADTFNDYLHPEVAKATAEALEHAGYRVVVPSRELCCGRPLYDYGMLTTARRLLERLCTTLGPYVRDGLHVVGIEPSCTVTFRDELVNMLPHDEDAKRLSLHTVTLSEFLTERAEDYEPPRLERRVVVHGHCHQEAVVGMSAEQALLERMGADVELLDSGCCGLAGSFGFEREHYDISMRIADHKFAPMLRAAPRDAVIVGDGFSCKHQAQAATDRRPLHLAQVLKMAREHGPAGVPGELPERAYPDVVLSRGRQ